jgi:hypothetical protein
MEYSERVATYEADRQFAIEHGTCFCLCGCRLGGATPSHFLGIVRPGLCPTCAAAAKTVKGAKAHHIPRNEAEALDHEDVEAGIVEDVPLRKRILRAIAPQDREKATEYARHYGEEGSQFMVAMYRRVAAGKVLTDAQVDAVMASKRADERSARATFKRTMAESKRKGKEYDLARIRIPDDLPEGDYVVTGDAGDPVILRVKRQKDGGFRGFTFIEGVFGEGVVRYGAQYPQPSRDVDKHPQTYRGYMPHLVAALVANPSKARADYELLLGKPV